jgi:hypothetical protein
MFFALKLKGLETYKRARGPIGKPILAVAGSPFRAKSGVQITQGKPWAKLSWPLRAVNSVPRLDSYFGNTTLCPSTIAIATEAPIKYGGR